MISRVSAEFETSELAELALKRARENPGGIYSSGVVYDRRSDKAVRLRNGTIYTVIPTAVTAHNYITAVMESPAAVSFLSLHADAVRRSTSYAIKKPLPVSEQFLIHLAV